MPDIVLKPRRTLAAFWLIAALVIWAGTAAFVLYLLSVIVTSDDLGVSTRLLKYLYPAILPFSLGTAAFWKFWKARKDRFILDDEGVIMRRDHDTRLYWREINEVQFDVTAQRCTLITTVGNYSFDRYDCADPEAAAQLIAQRKGLQFRDSSEAPGADAAASS